MNLATRIALLCLVASSPAACDGGNVGANVDAAADASQDAAGDASPDSGACTYVATPGAIEFRDMAGTDAVAKLEAAIAAAVPVFQPPAYPMGHGPTQAQGVVHIAFDPGSNEGQGTNALVLDSPIAFPSHVRLEVDSGVTLVWGSTTPGAMFVWDGVTDVTITRGNPCHGVGVSAGRFVVDLTMPNVGAKRFISLIDVDRWLIEQVHTLSEFQAYTQTMSANAATAITFNGKAADACPREGVYREHSNSGSGPSWGPNQIQSLFDSYIADIWTDGGAALRMESGTTNAGPGMYVGVHHVTAEHIFGQNGSYVVSLTPHHTPSDDVHITDVRGVSMYLGLVFQKSNDPTAVPAQVFTNTTVQGGCIIGGPDAQSPAVQGTTVGSVSAVFDAQSPASSITYDGIAVGGTFTGVPGGTGSCTLAEATNGP
ncbi:MAG: hypothetical protein ABI321_15180 [Polyangia bacterium]